MRKGQISITILIFSTVALILISGFVFLAGSFLNLSVRGINKAQAFSIAEGGIEYYRWHLAHAPEDYQDGTGHAGPYVHTYYDKSGNPIGSFTLTITPPPVGSTVVKIRSAGNIFADATVQKIIEVKMAVPSFAKYAWVLNSDVNFGTAAEVFGPLHSNGGIHFDGLAHNIVSSYLTAYNDPDHSGANEYAVHTHVNPVDPLPSSTLSARQDVFGGGRSINVPRVDFSKMTNDLSTLKQIASSTGLYFPSSTVKGYDVVFATSGIYTIYKITALQNPPGGCSNSGQTGWGTWSISAETPYASGTIPANGVMFFEDDIWIRGQINGKRVTIAAGRFPDLSSTRANATINNSLRYTNYDGTDVLSVLVQNNINIGLTSDNNLRVDGALIAQNGRIGRYSYSGCGSNSSRANFTSYGMLGSALRSGFYYSSSNGFQSRDYIYDSNLLYAPPPNFPLTGDQYVPISWDEVQ